MTRRKDFTLPDVRPLHERMRLDWYVAVLEWHLEGFTNGSRRKEIIRSLRNEVASEDRPLSQVLRDLGPASSLARRYVDESAVPRPTWSIGVIVAGIALLAYWAIFLSFTFGMLAAVEDSGAGEANGQFFFIDVLAFSNEGGIGIGWTSQIAWLLTPVVIVTVAFVLGSRVWRAFRKQHPAPLAASVE